MCFSHINPLPEWEVSADTGEKPEVSLDTRGWVRGIVHTKLD